MDVSRCAARSDSSPSRHGNGGRYAGQAALATFAAVGCALLALLVTAAPARAQDGGVPAQLTVTIVPPSGAAAPPPTGSVIVAIDGSPLLSLRLGGGIARLTSITPQLSVALMVLGRRVTIGYSGDSNYEASTGISVTLPTRSVLTIAARPRDTAAPAIEILSPGDGARYARGEAVAASYACRDPGDRSAVTTCDGPVASGGALDTPSPGTFTFTVKTADALGNAESRTVTYEVGDETAGPGEPASAPPAPTTASSNDVSGGGAHGSPTPPAAPPVVAPAGAGVQPPSPSPASSSLTQRSGPAPPASVTGAQNPAAPTAGASDAASASPVGQALAAYDPRSDPVKTLGILVAAFTLLQLGTSTGGLALARGAGGVVRATARRDSSSDGRGRRQQAPGPGSNPKPGFVYRSVDVKFLGAGLGAVAIGDRSRTWSWPGTERLDALGATLPARLARRSPLLARVAADGTYLRAILGSASLLGLLAGLALGVAALRDTGGDALPPAAALTIAIAVLGVLDAAAGLVAVLIFTIGVLALGGVDSSADLRLTLTLGALWFVVPVLAGAARPLRRPPTRRLEQSWDRAADFVIASLVGAWAVQKLVLALPGLAGKDLPIAEHADTAAFCVLAALVVRLAAETITAHLYPRRLDMTEAGDVPQPGSLQRLGASALRTAIFVFFAYIVVGTSWQLWAGAALFVVPQVLAVYEERFPNSPGLFRALPKGLVRLVLMLFVATAVGALLLRTMDEHSDTFLADSFVVLALPGFLLALLSLFGREGDQPAIGWGKRIAGIAILALGILLVLGLLLRADGRARSPASRRCCRYPDSPANAS
jgi:hypothetical protein